MISREVIAQLREKNSMVELEKHTYGYCGEGATAACWGTVRELLAELRYSDLLDAAEWALENRYGERDANACEHCGAVLLPRHSEPILCESCVPICSDNCDHRWEE